MARGKFIVFEGTDGSGKSTQLKLLAKYLTDRGIPVWCTAEPTKSAFGTLLRDCLSGKTETNERTIALMFAADRIDHVQDPACGMLAKLEAGYTVLSDRYYLSSFAYNGGLVPLEWVIELNRPAMQLLRPDLTVYLDLSAEDGMRRVARRGETERYESFERQRAVRENYLSLIGRFKEEENIVVVKGEDDIGKTQSNIRRAAAALFGGRL